MNKNPLKIVLHCSGFFDRGSERVPRIGIATLLLLAIAPLCAGAATGATAEKDQDAPPMPGVDVYEKLGDQIPLDLPFVDAQGDPVTLGQYFDAGKPVVLTMNYYNCPMLCGLVMNGVADAMEQGELAPGGDYQVITVSIDPGETPSLAEAKKRNYVEKIDRAGVEHGWAFLTGEQHNIKALAEAVGFGYKWVESRKQYAHPAVLMVLSPTGKITRYLYGIKFDPQTFRLSLVEASQGKIGSTIDRILLTCFHFDPSTGKYTWAAMALMRIAGVLTVLAIVTTIGLLLLWERRRRPSQVELT